MTPEQPINPANGRFICSPEHLMPKGAKGRWEHTGARETDSSSDYTSSWVCDDCGHTWEERLRSLKNALHLAGAAPPAASDLKCSECKQPVCDHVAQRVFNLAKQAEDSGWVACAERLPETNDDVELAWGDEPANMYPAIGYFEEIGGHWWGADGGGWAVVKCSVSAPKFWRPRRPIGALPPAPAKEGK